MEIFLQVTNKLEPIFIAGSSLGAAFLAIAVYRSNKRSATNIIFGLLSLSILLWLWSSFIAGLEIASSAIVFHRLAIFFAAPMSFLFFLFAHTMPNQKISIRKSNLLFTIIVTVIVMAINISPYAFIGTNGERNPVPGNGLVPFGVISSIFSLLAVYQLLRKYYTSEKKNQKQFRSVLIGIFAMLILVIGTILVPIVTFHSGIFIPFLPIYTMIFLSMTAYAITKYQLFNIKIILTQSITVVIWITLLSKIFISETLTEYSINILVFLITVVFGILLIKSVSREIEQREKIEKQEKEMELINAKLGAANERLKELDKQKSEFIGFASHQLRSPLTAIKGYASLVLEGDYGQISDDLRHAAQIIFESANTLVTVVSDYLNVSSIELGQMKYDFKALDLNDLVKSVIEELKQNVEKKGLKLTYECDTTKTYFVKMDREKVKQVLMNIIDNSAKYTLNGEVKVSLTKNPPGNILFAVKDTGIGISKDTIPKLFAKFIRAKNANETNIRGTGLGLFIAKEIITAHGGRIWVESEGEGKGSQFYVELGDKNY